MFQILLDVRRSRGALQGLGSFKTQGKGDGGSARMIAAAKLSGTNARHGYI